MHRSTWRSVSFAPKAYLSEVVHVHGRFFKTCPFPGDSNQSIDKSNVKRPKMESEGSTSSKPKAKDAFLSLPSDILSKIISYIPIVQWNALALLDENIRASILIAWRQLRTVNLERDFLTNAQQRSSIDQSVKSVVQKLVERSSFLTSLSGMSIRSDNAALNSDTVQLLVQFEHLQSITFGDAKFRRRVPLETVVDFLESTRSRSSLKELRLFNVVQREGDRVTVLDRFASSLASGREIQLPLKLEKFSFASSFDPWLNIRLDTMDTTRLTDVRLGKAWVDPDQLSNLIERATANLRRIELTFLHCHGYCKGPRLEANKKLLTALASCEQLTTLKFGELGCNNDTRCTNFKSEFIDMLKSIGRRGQLRKLAMEEYFVHPSTVDVHKICETIRDHIPYLRSIKLCGYFLSGRRDLDIVRLLKLEEIHLTSEWHPQKIDDVVISKIAQLPRLKRLAIDQIRLEDTSSLGCLAMAPALMDLRIAPSYGQKIGSNVLVKWSDGLASKLRCLILTEIDTDNEDECRLVRLLENAVRLRVLILEGHVSDRSLMAIAKSCPELEMLGVTSYSNAITIQPLQEIVDHCPNLKRMGRFGDAMRSQLRFPKYRKIVDVDFRFWNYGFDDSSPTDMRSVQHLGLPMEKAWD